MAKGKNSDFSSGRLIMGRNALRELLKTRPQSILEVYCAEEVSSKEKSRLVKEVQDSGIKLHFSPSEELSRMAGSASHQSFLARVDESTSLTLAELLDTAAQNAQSLIIALDGVKDPQNLGAVFRVAECFGSSGVVYPERKSAAITPVVSKASAGASEIVPHARVKNLAHAIEECKQKGFWCVVSALSERATPIDEFTFPDKTLLVLGAEGEGVRDLTRKAADFEVAIPMSGRIDSLNVSQAAAVFSFCWRQSTRYTGGS